MLAYARDKDGRNKAGKELGNFVSYMTSELHGERLQAFNNELNRRIIELTHSTSASSKLGGITAIENFIGLESEDNSARLYRFYQYLKPNLPCNDPQVMIAAAKVLGRVSKYGGHSLGDQFIEFEVLRALDFLQGERNENGRYAAVLIIKEIARNVPYLFHAYVSRVIDHIWVALRDPKVTVREAAAEALGACFQIISKREKQLGTQAYETIYDEAEHGLKDSHVDTIHGSLLAILKLLRHSKTFMRTRLHRTCELILRLHRHRDPLIKRTVTNLIPVLAAYDPEYFAGEYLRPVMLVLIEQLSRERDKSTKEFYSDTLEAIGLVSTAMGAKMAPFVEPIMQATRDSLAMRGKKNAPPEAPTFFCIGNLATAVGELVQHEIRDMLDTMFACGLSTAMVSALEQIVQAIPILLPIVQDRLLNMLSQILIGVPYRPLGAPLPRRAPLQPFVVNNAPDAKGIELYTVALQTLGSFDFSGHILNEFVRDCTLPYLDLDAKEVRKAAAVTCAHMFVNDPICYQSSVHAIEVFNDVLDKLMTVAIADLDPDLRLTVLSVLDEHFDHHLAQTEYIRSIFVALNDEEFAVREVAVGILGRLAKHNPAYVMPSLRKMLIQLLTGLEFSTVSRHKEEIAQLLTGVVKASHRLVKSYALTILEVLQPKADDSNPGVAARVLECIGELARVGGGELQPHLDELVSLCVVQLSSVALHSSLIKRDAALKTLGRLASNTGYVVNPYLAHPTLLGSMVKILKTEQTPTVRREAIRVLGILGALDPYRHKLLENHTDSNTVAGTSSTSSNGATDLFELATVIGTSTDEYYQNVAVEALIGILNDPALSAHHHAAIEAIMYMFKTQGLKCVTFLPQIIPVFLKVIRTCGSGLSEFYYQQLAILISIIKQHVRNYLNEIFALIQEDWNPNSNIQLTIVALVEAIARALEGEFKAYLPQLLPNLLQTLSSETSPKRQPTLLRMLQALNVFGANLEEYMHLVLPVIVSLYERADVPVAVRRAAILTVGQLTRKMNLADQVSRVIHPLLRVLQSNVVELRTPVMDTLCAIAYLLGPTYAMFIGVVHKVMVQQRIAHSRYQQVVGKILANEPIPQDLLPTNMLAMDKSEDAPHAEASKMAVNQQHLKAAWDTSRISTVHDWREWLRRIAVEFLRESPSHALRACRSLAEVYHPLALELFNAGFVSCWVELYDSYQESLVRAIETALDAPEIPDQVVHALLNLTEFMEHDDKALPISINMLGDRAYKFHSYAKALHYKEAEFLADPSPQIVELLIDINTKLQQSDAAFGALTYARENMHITHHEEWYEKLHRWEEALSAYDRHAKEHPEDLETVFGQMRCLHALGEWEHLTELVQEKWPLANADGRRKMAPLAAAAAWSFGQWDMMDEFIAAMRVDSSERSFYRAVLAVHRSQRSQTKRLIARARDALDNELTALISESYGRAYGLMVRTQMLSELEEALAYKLEYADQPDRQELMRSIWMKRLQGCELDVEVWQRILSIRSIVITPADDTETWIKFANLCRKSGRMVLAEKTLNSLLGPDANATQMDASAQLAPKAPPAVIYSHLKFMWACGAKSESLSYLRDFTSNLAEDLGMSNVDEQQNLLLPDLRASPRLAEFARLLARCYFKQGEWQVALHDEWVSDDECDVIQSYKRATELDRDWYKAWHAWALSNFDVITHHERRGEAIPFHEVAASIVPSVQGFFRSIALASDNSLQDTLRLLTLWFKFGHLEHIADAVRQGFASVSVDTWLEVIPQMIARISAPSPRVRRLIHHLLADVGTAHPQALVYPLTVATKSPSALRMHAATGIMDTMREHSPVLVEQAILVSDELIRIAILWHEMWHEGLEEASRLYFTEHNIDGMFATLGPLHDLLEKGPETLRETSFAQTHGRDLNEAHEYVRRYRQFGEISDLNQAWDLYYHVFKRITKQLPASNSVQLALQYVSPKLLALRDLELAIPGSYVSGQPIVRITQFEPVVLVISSKQRPRRLKIKGSDGKTYQYLLKGHEDMRQDERVMQLFGLVNTLLSTDTESYKRRLSLRRFPVIPLSPNTGMLGWVANSDTLHILIKEYREQHKILLNIEHRLMLQMAPDYDNLTIMEKVEVFEYALDNTPGQDLYRVLWLKSRNSEAWLERRTAYMRSLATSSMAGYILGLGDRHPSNLLLDRKSGEVIHIDFGDCFEIACHRPKFPEKVPFRLTRMLIKAMEVGGVNGTFKITAENTMRVLRDNRESVLALLEAFVHDPLISWRLVTDVDTEQRAPDAREHEPTTSVRGGEGEARNQRALEVVRRIQNKLSGRDFNPNFTLSVPDQVQRLVQDATCVENLCVAFIGWCAFW
ncbi:non-specific serine/threonine protein kinase [Malassezia yamatoensis]|uniref:Serine/threonine-protein kinase TOR n=1 Tax=Malassezia yamatoensis TaxID=253288 RepID=A0AAJ5YXJ4_9BASI|nr:non-specific serine/threonine protein kinase [Malassezia yamatoensis]